MSTDTVEPTRAEIRRHQRQGLIIAAAEDQLGESGVAGTTLERVGERVGLSKGALYYYVDGRDQLLALVLDDVLTEIRRDTAKRAGGETSPLSRLRCFAHAHVHAAVDRPAGQLIVTSVDLLAAHEPSAKLLHRHEAEAREFVELAVDAGELRDVSPAVGAAVLFGALNTLPRTYDPAGPLTLDELVDIALDLLFHGWTVTAR